MKYYHYYLFYFLLLSTFNTYAFQANNGSDSTNQIKIADWKTKRAYALGSKSINDSTHWYFAEARKTYKDLKNWKQYVMSYYYQCSMYALRADYDSSIFMYKKTINIAKEVLSPPDDILILALYNSLGGIYTIINSYIEAKKTYLEAINYLDVFGEKKQFAYQYMGLAKIYEVLGDLNKSIEYWDKAYIIFEKNNMRKSLYAVYFDNKSDVLVKKRKFIEAEMLKLKSLELYEKSKNLSGILSCYDFLGRIAVKKEEYDKALKWYNKGMDSLVVFNKKSKYPFDFQLSLNYMGLGNVYSYQKQYDIAQKYYLKGYETGNKFKPLIPGILLGKNHLNLNNFDSALFYFQDAIVKHHFDFNDTDIYTNPPNITGTKYRNDLLMLLKAKGKALRLKYSFSNNSTIKDIETAYKTNLQTLSLVDTIYADFTSGFSKLDWSETMLSIYEESIKTSLTLYQINKKNELLEKAFEIAERSKAGTLTSNLKANSAKLFSNIPDSLLEKESDIKSQISSFKSNLNSELSKKDKQDSSKIIQYKEKIFALNRKHEDLEKLFETQYTKYYQLKYNNEHIKISDIQKNVLDQNTTLIEYFVGDSSIYAFTISKNEFKIKDIPFIDDLEQKVKNIQLYLKDDKIEEYASLSYELYEQLIKPLNIKNPNLIIIPDGALWQLNFDLLLSQKSDNPDYRSLSYLIKDHTISYAYSAKLLKLNLGQKTSPSTKDVLAFSYNDADNPSVGNYIAMRGFRDDKLADLPGTRKEIKAVSSVVDGSYYFGSYANEKNFKENAKDYRILHLALHGVIDNEDPMKSRLYFTQNKDTLEDNFLYAYELYNMELSADLAVLSACNTGAGKLAKGEGIMSLGRAFTYAGCKSLLLSQWEVSDAFTPAIMKNFYTNLKEGKTKSESLREAKLAHLSSADNQTANPYYWAPLVQLGDNRPLKNENYWYWVIGIISIAVLVGFIVFWRKKSN